MIFLILLYCARLGFEDLDSLETKLESKGECLEEILKSQAVYRNNLKNRFLAASALPPCQTPDSSSYFGISHIIFIDNELSQVISVEKVCLERDLPCKAFHFTSKKQFLS